MNYNRIQQELLVKQLMTDWPTQIRMKSLSWASFESNFSHSRTSDKDPMMLMNRVNFLYLRVFQEFIPE